MLIRRRALLLDGTAEDLRGCRRRVGSLQNVLYRRDEVRQVEGACMGAVVNKVIVFDFLARKQTAHLLLYIIEVVHILVTAGHVDPVHVKVFFR